MTNRLAIIAALGAALMIIIFGTALFTAMYKKSANTDIESIAMQKEIGLSEITQHAKAKDCWTYIGGQVFNATIIIAEYPEHSDTLVKACGRDGASVYTVKEYSSQAMDKKDIVKVRDALGAYQIGLLAPTQ